MPNSLIMTNNSSSIQNLYRNANRTVSERGGRLYRFGMDQLKSLRPFFDRIETKAAPCIKFIRKAALPVIQRPIALHIIAGATAFCVDSLADCVVEKILNVRWVIFSNQLSKFVARTGISFLVFKTIVVLTAAPLNNKLLLMFFGTVIVLKQLIYDYRTIKNQKATIEAQTATIESQENIRNHDL